jgi:hypothetical protein
MENNMNKCLYNSGSNFDRKGQWVIGKYLDECFVTGVVQDSRVKYGGKVQHTVLSDSPSVMNSNKEVRNIGSTFLIEENKLMQCEDFSSTC